MHPTIRSLRPLPGLVLVLALLLGLGACSEDEEPTAIEQVTVGGEFGALPQVTFPTPLEVTETSTTTVLEGEGATLAEGEVALLSYLAVNAETGEVIEDNFGSQPQTTRITEEDAGPLYADLLGSAEGTRLLRVELGTAERPEPVVLVYDIMHTRAWGEPVSPPDDAPQVSLADSGEPSVTIPDHDPPSDLEIIPLRQGDGAQVRSGMAVTVRYTAVGWSDGEVVDSTWTPGQAPTTIAFTGLIEGWQNGLVDTRVGSQIMLVVPPEQAFGDDTLVYVIDVLAVSAMDGTEGAG
ncbi:MAG TPA: FKBP-type peptidyl-prolyl cis-trans isomerase [Candidatus Ruania gallistercoris]|uniref:Peptidyl-prolyl cis-trans isomerase n=1 Tax=Candidatus Ruania gallistercoris TaxID=2838746 RepID=A0A9D2J4K4_9MICO|nr:FKBP-type peptidyl-prolyl cis-trans isomerase [Candidatus Ruania gallistercoris]